MKKAIRIALGYIVALLIALCLAIVVYVVSGGYPRFFINIVVLYGIVGTLITIGMIVIDVIRETVNHKE